MKDTFYFMLKAPFALEIFTFLSWPFGYVEKWIDKKAKANLKICDIIDWTKNSTQVLSNISRTLGNQTMKFGQ